MAGGYTRIMGKKINIYLSKNTRLNYLDGPQINPNNDRQLPVRMCCFSSLSAAIPRIAPVSFSH